MGPSSHSQSISGRGRGYMTFNYNHHGGGAKPRNSQGCKKESQAGHQMKEQNTFKDGATETRSNRKVNRSLDEVDDGDSAAPTQGKRMRRDREGHFGPGAAHKMEEAAEGHGSRTGGADAGPRAILTEQPVNHGPDGRGTSDGPAKVGLDGTESPTKLAFDHFLAAKENERLADGELKRLLDDDLTSTEAMRRAKQTHDEALLQLKRSHDRYKVAHEAKRKQFPGLGAASPSIVAPAAAPSNPSLVDSVGGASTTGAPCASASQVSESANNTAMAQVAAPVPAAPELLKDSRSRQSVSEGRPPRPPRSLGHGAAPGPTPASHVVSESAGHGPAVCRPLRPSQCPAPAEVSESSTPPQYQEPPHKESAANGPAVQESPKSAGAACAEGLNGAGRETQKGVDREAVGEQCLTAGKQDRRTVNAKGGESATSQMSSPGGAPGAVGMIDAVDAGMGDVEDGEIVDMESEEWSGSGWAGAVAGGEGPGLDAPQLVARADNLHERAEGFAEQQRGAPVEQQTKQESLQRNPRHAFLADPAECTECSAADSHGVPPVAGLTPWKALGLVPDVAGNAKGDKNEVLMGKTDLEQEKAQRLSAKNCAADDVMFMGTASAETATTDIKRVVSLPQVSPASNIIAPGMSAECPNHSQQPGADHSSLLIKKETAPVVEGASHFLATIQSDKHQIKQHIKALSSQTTAALHALQMTKYSSLAKNPERTAGESVSAKAPNPAECATDVPGVPPAASQSVRSALGLVSHSASGREATDLTPPSPALSRSDDGQDDDGRAVTSVSQAAQEDSPKQQPPPHADQLPSPEPVAAPTTGHRLEAATVDWCTAHGSAANGTESPGEENEIVDGNSGQGPNVLQQDIQANMEHDGPAPLTETPSETDAKTVPVASMGLKEDAFVGTEEVEMDKQAADGVFGVMNQAVEKNDPTPVQKDNQTPVPQSSSNRSVDAHGSGNASAAEIIIASAPAHPNGVDDKRQRRALPDDPAPQKECGADKKHGAKIVDGGRNGEVMPSQGGSVQEASDVNPTSNPFVSRSKLSRSPPKTVKTTDDSTPASGSGTLSWEDYLPVERSVRKGKRRSSSGGMLAGERIIALDVARMGYEWEPKGKARAKREAETSEGDQPKKHKMMAPGPEVTKVPSGEVDVAHSTDSPPHVPTHMSIGGQAGGSTLGRTATAPVAAKGNWTPSPKAMSDSEAVGIGGRGMSVGLAELLPNAEWKAKAMSAPRGAEEVKGTTVWKSYVNTVFDAEDGAEDGAQDGGKF